VKIFLINKFFRSIEGSKEERGEDIQGVGQGRKGVNAGQLEQSKYTWLSFVIGSHEISTDSKLRRGRNKEKRTSKKNGTEGEGDFKHRISYWEAGPRVDRDSWRGRLVCLMKVKVIET